MIQSKNLLLKKLKIIDVTEFYVEWLNNPNTNRFLEVRHYKHTINSVRKFVLEMQNSKNDYLFGIFLRNKTHIGNIKIGPINFFHKIAEISYFIGDQKYLRKGYASEALIAIEDFAFKKLKLFKLSAGVYSNNIAGIKILKKVGYLQEGKRLKHYIYQKKRIDIIYFGKINNRKI
tara:strand:- start:147 stop:671 length:525 start_codon:yes stop_codon:yes gene_type:complete